MRVRAIHALQALRLTFLPAAADEQWLCTQHATLELACVCAGVVALWDVTTGQQLSEYEAHEKRIWTVDFCHSDPMHFVSGSDDGWVKVRPHSGGRVHRLYMLSGGIGLQRMRACICCQPQEAIRVACRSGRRRSRTAWRRLT